MQITVPKLRKTLSQQEENSEVYTDILAKIMRGDLAPGQRLIEEDLARAYNVSRTPIREVLLALEKDGLVERMRNRGARVAAFTPDVMEEIYEIRKALECLSVRNAARNIPMTLLIDFERRLEGLAQQKGDDWHRRQSEIDLEFHRAIVAHSGNRRLMDYLENISVLIHSLRLVGYANSLFARRAGEEHLAIVRALMRRDAQTAEALLAEHIDNSKHHALAAFSRRGQQPAGWAPNGAPPQGPLLVTDLANNQ